MFRLGENVKLDNNIVPLSRLSAGAVNGASVARGEYDAVLAICPAGAIGGSSAADFKLQESDNGSDWTDIAGAAATQLSATDDNKMPSIDARLTKKYVRAVHTVTGTGGVECCVVLVLYNSKSVPVTNSPATVVV